MSNTTVGAEDSVEGGVSRVWRWVGGGGGGRGLPRYLIVKDLYLYDHPRIVSFFIDYFIVTIVVERRRFSSTN